MQRHIGWDVPMHTAGSGRDLRKAGHHWCVVVSGCVDCSDTYTSLPRNSYLMWRSSLPVKCDHDGTITDIYVSPEGKPEEGRELVMPTRIRYEKQPQGSESSGGLVTSAKLTNDLNKITERGREAIRHLRSYADEAVHDPAPAFFPELQREYVLTQLSLVEERMEDLQTALEDQIVAKRRQEGDFRGENVDNPAQHSTPQREQQRIPPLDGQGQPVLPPRPPRAEQDEQEFHTPGGGAGDQGAQDGAGLYVGQVQGVQGVQPAQGVGGPGGPALRRDGTPTPSVPASLAGAGGGAQAGGARGGGPGGPPTLPRDRASTPPLEGQ